MSRLLFCLFLGLVCVQAQAQDGAAGRHSILIAAGVSMAPEELAGIKQVDEKGYVRNGPAAGISYLYRFFKYAGAGVTVSHSRNNLNAEAIGGASSSEVEAEAYNQTFVLADVYGLYSFRRWQLYVKGGIGAVIANNWQMSADNKIASGTVTTGGKPNLAYAGAAGVSYRLSNGFSVGASSALLASKPEFEFKTGQSISHQKQWLSAFNHSVQVGFHF